MLISSNRAARAIPFAVAALLLLFVLLQAWPGCHYSASGTPANGAAADTTLLDTARLTAGNLGSRLQYTFPYVLPPGDSVVALDGLLAGSARNRTLSWTVDGKPVAGGLVALQCEPAENHVLVHRISVHDAGRARDEFTLVVIPSSTARKFEEWLLAERKDRQWTRALPPVYSSLLPGGMNPEPDNCNPKHWPVLRKINVQYHPGAAYEMRSVIQPDGSGHQATYDMDGNLLREGTAAGSADRASPRPYNPFRLIAHRDRDVIPFVWAAQLDGNPVNPKAFYADLDAPLVREGDRLRAYMSVRPTFSPPRREVPPGVCIDAHAP